MRGGAGGPLGDLVLQPVSQHEQLGVQQLVDVGALETGPRARRRRRSSPRDRGRSGPSPGRLLRARTTSSSVPREPDRPRAAGPPRGPGDLDRPVARLPPRPARDATPEALGLCAVRRPRALRAALRRRLVVKLVVAHARTRRSPFRRAAPCSRAWHRGLSSIRTLHSSDASLPPRPTCLKARLEPRGSRLSTPPCGEGTAPTGRRPRRRTVGSATWPCSWRAMRGRRSSPPGYR